MTTHPTSLTLPRATGHTRAAGGAAPLQAAGAQVLQAVLFAGGAVLLPLGLVVIILGWYGAAHTPYEYDQLSYLISGGLLGLGLTFCGGFLYFGAWLARIAADQRASAARLGDALIVLSDVVSHNASGQAVANGITAHGGPGAVLVVAGNGMTVHRVDCTLIATRDDLRPAGPDAAGLVPCRICAPGT